MPAATVIVLVLVVTAVQMADWARNGGPHDEVILVDSPSNRTSVAIHGRHAETGA
jgi:hypothetical protein